MGLVRLDRCDALPSALTWASAWRIWSSSHFLARLRASTSFLDNCWSLLCSCSAARTALDMRRWTCSGLVCRELLGRLGVSNLSDEGRGCRTIAELRRELVQDRQRRRGLGAVLHPRGSLAVAVAFAPDVERLVAMAALVTVGDDPPIERPLATITIFECLSMARHGHPEQSYDVACKKWPTWDYKGLQSAD